MGEPLDIAIVGLGCVFPGAASPAQFWQNITARRDAVGPVPPGRWILDPTELIGPAGAADHVLHSRAGYVDETALDPHGLNLPPAKFAKLDPLFRFVLHAGAQALRAARVVPDLQRTGVALAAIALPTDGLSEITRHTLGVDFENALRAARGLPPLPMQLDQPLNLEATALPAGVLAAALGLGGGTFTLDAACASSLYAIRLACDELTAGRSDAMLAGGVSRPDCLYTQMGFGVLGALSPSGMCRPFDAAADGLIVGEGCGIVLLKRREDAEHDGDEIFGIIRGVGLSNDVAGSLLAADSEGQLRALRAAYAQAGWSPQQVQYIECHGTGTPLGDAVELRSLRTLWGQHGWHPGQCALGAVKAMIGHTLTAAGAAGLIRTLLALRARHLPPTLHFTQPAAESPLREGPLRILTESAPWPTPPDSPRRAAVSAFGFGGINAHLLVEEHRPTASLTRRVPPSARSTENDAIAIVGLEVRLGACGTLDQFQAAALGTAPQYHPAPTDGWAGAPGLSGPGAFIDELAIEVGAYRLPPAEINEILPQQLLMLQAAVATVPAGPRAARDPDSRSGVLIGMGLDPNTANYQQRWRIGREARRWAAEAGLTLSAAQLAEWARALRDSSGPPLSAPRVLGSLGSVIASRIARELAWGGPSYAVSAAENSGLRALEQAVRLLQARQLDRVLVGAVDLATDPRARLACSALRGGDVPAGDGAIALLLKRRRDAERDGDRILALIRGIGAAGGAVGEVSPAALERAIRSALAEASVDFDAVGYHEVNAVDAPTIAALLNGLASARRRPESDAAGQPAVVSSLASIFGDTGAASGLLGLARAVLCLHHDVLPPWRDGALPLPDRASFRALEQAGYWWNDRAAGPRRAGVTSMGLDGTAMHVVLEAPATRWGDVPVSTEPPHGPRTPALFAAHGDDTAALVNHLKQLAAHTKAATMPLEHLARAWHAHHGAVAAGHRVVAFVAESIDELRAQLTAAVEHLCQNPGAALHGRDGVYYVPQPLDGARVAFVYPGSGNYFAGMGRHLARDWPEVLRRLDYQTEHLASQHLPELFLAEAPPRPPTHVEMLLGQVTFGIAMTGLLRGLGAAPSAALGYSLGETTSLLALGAWPNRDELFQRLTRSPLFHVELAGECRAARRAWGVPDGEPVDWQVAVLNQPAERVREALCDRTYLLIINAPGECVIGGQRAAVQRVIQCLGANAALIEGAASVHCPLIESVAAEYRDLHELPTVAPAGIDFYNPAWGRPYHPDAATAAESILAQARTGFDFARAVRRAWDDGVRIFVEVGPQASCTRMIWRILDGRPHVAVAASTAGEPETRSVLRVLAALLSQRALRNLDGLYGGSDAAPVVASTARASHGVVRVPVGRKQPRPRWPDQPARWADSATLRPARPPTPARRSGAPNRRHGGTAVLSDTLRETTHSATAAAAAHAAFLRFTETAATGIAETLSRHTALLERVAPSSLRALRGQPSRTPEPASPPAPLAPVVFSRDQCLEFARGSAARVLGPAFAAVDTFAKRVRLPDEPLMLVDRIVALSGESGSLGRGTIATEHDVHGDAWYLDNGRTPVCVAVEAGQADLFLCAYLGIDLAVRGTRAYRLLDARIRFHRSLPRVGETIRYDIAIDRFVQQGDAWLFFFRFEATIDGAPLLSMTNGCAGFFTDQEIGESRGLVLTPEQEQPATARLPAPAPLVPMQMEAYSAAQLDALRAGDLAGCFGPLFANLPLRDPLRLPAGSHLRLLHRIVELDPAGGRFGLGRICGEADIHPDDWFLTCHFVDDMVMPGTLMYECCAHTLRVLLLRMGWVGEQSQAGYEPLLDRPCTLKCRGPVTPQTRVVTYDVQLKEIGYGPEPYVVADAYMYADGRRIVMFSDMSMRVVGLTRAGLEALWNGQRPTVAPLGAAELPDGPRPARFGRDRILEFAIGSPAKAFGEPYQPFEAERRIARLPGPPYLLLDRLTQIEAPAWELRPGGWIEGQYDLPADAWFLAANRQASVPFAILLEIALQPCGWLAAYLGSALRSTQDLRFRNLGGRATLHREVFADGGTLTTRVRITDVSEAGGMLIEKFDMQIWQRRQLVYAGDTYFGFFSEDALAQQVGIRGAAARAAEIAPDAVLLALPSEVPQAPDDPRRMPASRAALPARALLMLDQIDACALTGGPHGLGLVRGTKRVDPAEWFFAAHFYQDPVCPGSLGLESFLQLLKVYALRRWPECERTHRFEPIAVGLPHEWTYRGQIVPRNRRVEVDAIITRAEPGATPLVVASGFLKVDGVFIYEMKDFGLRLVR